MRKIKRQGVAVDKLAQKLAEKKRLAGEKAYTKGHNEEKVWINFQVSKGMKREFSDICGEHHINASAFLRGAIKILLAKKGDAKNTLLNIKEQLEDSSQK
jgi:hypothetical protein